MYGYISLLLFLIPVGVLGWRVVVSKTRQQWLRVGGAAAAMVTLVGAVVVYPSLEDFDFKDWRADAGLVAAMIGSVYLIMWSQRKRTNRRHRTFSIVAAIVGFVPVIASLATTLLFKR